MGSGCRQHNEAARQASAELEIAAQGRGTANEGSCWSSWENDH